MEKLKQSSYKRSVSVYFLPLSLSHVERSLSLTRGAFPYSKQARARTGQPTTFGRKAFSIVSSEVFVLEL